jgi:hypothetical protein
MRQKLTVERVYDGILEGHFELQSVAERQTKKERFNRPRHLDLIDCVGKSLTKPFCLDGSIIDPTPSDRL